jgi:DNA repair protein RadC
MKKIFNQPSQKEIFVTKRLVKAAKILDIEFLDHIIIEKKGYHSFDQLNLL